MTLQDMLNKTQKRQSGFVLMLEHLKSCNNPLIIETGCARQEDNFAGDGMSTLIFDQYINDYNGEFYSVDLSPNSVAFAKSKISSKTNLHNEDSISFLWNLNATLTNQNHYIDLLYLDSFDFEHHNPYPSSAHHLKELTAIISRLRPGSLIAVDDNFGVGENRTGKGMYVEQFMKAIGKPMIHEGYQLIWKF